MIAGGERPGSGVSLLRNQPNNGRRRERFLPGLGARRAPVRLLGNERHNARWRDRFLSRFGPRHAAVQLLTFLLHCRTLWRSAPVSVPFRIALRTIVGWQFIPTLACQAVEVPQHLARANRHFAGQLADPSMRAPCMSTKPNDPFSSFRTATSAGAPTERIPFLLQAVRPVRAECGDH